jgi:hypothetical protein
MVLGEEEDLKRPPLPQPVIGAKNMSIVGRFALGLVRANRSKRSVKTRRKSASWDTSYLLELK